MNADLQGSAAIILAAITSALPVTGGQLSDQPTVTHGANTFGTGTGIAGPVPGTYRRGERGSNFDRPTGWMNGLRNSGLAAT